MAANKTLAGNRRRRKLMTALWFAAVSILTIVLIYWEMTAVLYILATLGVTGLLGIVAFSDLGTAHGPAGEIERVNDAAAIGSGISSTFGNK
ncbi:MAG TPA: hypothetical protein VJV03_05230 [Pyrinomonadaceae bacterium]|nr:hypothetical protein [Pyrinomonadaceae bacterium]